MSKALVISEVDFSATKVKTIKFQQNVTTELYRNDAYLVSDTMAINSQISNSINNYAGQNLAVRRFEVKQNWIVTSTQWTIGFGSGISYGAITDANGNILKNFGAGSPYSIEETISNYPTAKYIYIGVRNTIPTITATEVL
jgi:hypothetical protein